jgi:hypothetical protein
MTLPGARIGEFEDIQQNEVHSQLCQANIRQGDDFGVYFLSVLR